MSIRCLTLVALLAAGCGGATTAHAKAPRAATATATPRPTATAAPNRFDADRAWSLIKLQLGYGQRPAGSPQLRALARVLVHKLPAGHFEAVPGKGLRNIVGTLPGRSPGLVIGAHYDTLAAPKGFVGANNGASGSAIVIELAQAIAKLHRGPNAPQIRFVLFDGEEPAQGLPEQSTDFYDTGLRGSRAYVDAHPHDTSMMVLLDYVAGRGLQLPREGTSDPTLWARIRHAAAAVGAGAIFPNTTGTSLLDDHSPFLRAGVPAVDLIDWSYPGHTLQDGLDLLSHTSVNAVGETMAEFVRELDSYTS